MFKLSGKRFFRSQIYFQFLVRIAVTLRVGETKSPSKSYESCGLLCNKVPRDTAHRIVHKDFVDSLKPICFSESGLRTTSVTSL